MKLIFFIIFINSAFAIEIDKLKLIADEILLKSKLNLIDLTSIGRITGGQEAVPNSLPYQVGLSILNNNGLITWCGGSIISDKYVLTAGHCLEEAKMAHIFLGAHNIRKDCIKIKVLPINFIIHEKFNRTNLNNDIALIKLPSKISFNDIIQPIELTQDNTKNFEGLRVIASGWGKYSDKKKFTSNVLRFVELKIINKMECIKSYENLITSEKIICTKGDQGKSTCSGDSGGPLVYSEPNGKKTLIGVTSFGSRLGCELGYPAVYTQVSLYLDWLSAKMKSQQ